jgi:hypothetical protein
LIINHLCLWKGARQISRVLQKKNKKNSKKNRKKKNMPPKRAREENEPPSARAPPARRPADRAFVVHPPPPSGARGLPDIFLDPAVPVPHPTSEAAAFTGRLECVGL